MTHDHRGEVPDPGRDEATRLLVAYPILPGGSPIPAAPRGPLAPGVLVSRRCTCGGLVTASRLDPGPGVAEHNRTAAHKAWAKREGLDGGQGDE